MVDSCLHCKFRNGAWRPRVAFQDRVLSFEDRIIYIDGQYDDQDSLSICTEQRSTPEDVANVGETFT